MIVENKQHKRYQAIRNEENYAAVIRSESMKYTRFQAKVER